MKVRELIEALNKLDPNLDIFCWSEDEKLLEDNRMFVLFDIEHVDMLKGHRTRLEDHTPYFKIDNSAPETFATLQVTSDF